MTEPRRAIEVAPAGVRVSQARQVRVECFTVLPMPVAWRGTVVVKSMILFFFHRSGGCLAKADELGARPPEPPIECERRGVPGVGEELEP